MKELIGFNNFPNDFVNFSLRAKLSKKYGFFGKIPMWAGVRLHQFYPPLSTLSVRILGIRGTILFYLIFTFWIWSHYHNPLTALLYLLGFYHFSILLCVGRLSEFFGYSLVAFSFLNSNPIFSGISLGLSGLFYPLPFFVGLFILLFKFNLLIYLIAFLVCGWWYIPFILNYRKISFLKEKRTDKILGLYYMQWMSIFNLIIFLFGNLWLKITVSLLAWLYPGHLRYGLFPGKIEFKGYIDRIKSKIKIYVFLWPFFCEDIPRVIPGINKIKESTVVLEYPFCDEASQDRYSGSLKPWIWACANYLIDKGIIVYNGLPSTEVPLENIKIPENIKRYSLRDLGLKSTEKEEADLSNLKNAIYQIIDICKKFVIRIKNKGFLSAYNHFIFTLLYGIRWKWWIKFLTIWAPFPQSVEIEVSTSCNLRCIICELTYWKEPPRLMSLDEFKSIVDQFPKLRFIALTGIGENFLNKNLLDMYRYVKKKWPHIYIELYDSFYFIDEDIAHILINEINLDEVLISIDSSRKETYEKIRVNSDFERVVENIRSFLKVKRKSKKYYPKVSFHFIVNRLNKDEMVEFLEWVNSLRNGEQVSVFFTRLLHSFSEIEALFVDVDKVSIERIEKKAQELGINIRWNLDIPLEKCPAYYCGNWLMPFIFVTGEVIPCCAMNEANAREMQRKMSLGNVFKENFRDIWKNEKYKRLRMDIRKGKIPPFCFNCPMFSEVLL
ncbi:MAG: radical SAM protein [Candidatus Omnitrophica bacterium]|nr:radical SAM protein [Candidatus Omnitrophota bacterium]